MRTKAQKAVTAPGNKSSRGFGVVLKFLWFVSKNNSPTRQQDMRSEVLFAILLNLGIKLRAPEENVQIR